MTLEVVVSGPDAQRRVPVALEQRLDIGRDPECDVVLDDLDVSRRHIQIEAHEGGWWVQDRSSNGTYVGQRFLLQDSMLCHGDAGLRVGPYHIALLRTRATSEPDKRPPSPPATHLANQVPTELRRQIHRELLRSLNLAELDRNRLNDRALKDQVRAALARLVREREADLPAGVRATTLVDELVCEALGLGPLEELLADEAVSEIMVVDSHTIYCERGGRIERTRKHFTDDDAVRAAIERIVTPLGRRIDESSPCVDARLKDGSRVNAVIPPLALRGPCITIRKFQQRQLHMEDLVKGDSLSTQMARFLERSVKARKNIIISGGTGSGKTTLLNILSAAVSPEERIVTIEDAAELKLDQEHVVSLEARPPNMEGHGAVSIRDLLRNALRMRPDRIVVGECRGGEAIDMLQAMNTGHEGSMTTTHANSPSEAVARLETLSLMAGLDLPSRAIREQIAGSIDLVVQQTRLSDGSRRITSIAEVVGIADEGHVEVQEIFHFRRSGTSGDGTACGHFAPTGYLPSYLAELIGLGLATGEDIL